jgi:hypothetical protein
VVRLGVKRPAVYRRVVLLDDLLVGGYADAEVVCDAGGSSGGSSGADADCCRTPATIRVYHAFGCAVEDGSEVVAEAGREIGALLNEDLDDEVDGTCGRYEAAIDDCPEACEGDSSGSGSSGDDDGDDDGTGDGDVIGPGECGVCTVESTGSGYCVVDQSECTESCGCRLNPVLPGVGEGEFPPEGTVFLLGCSDFFGWAVLPECV